MTRNTVRSAEDDGSFVEHTTGDTPYSSVELTFNAKGQAQYSLKLYFSDVEALTTGARAALVQAINSVEEALTIQHIPLAGGDR